MGVAMKRSAKGLGTITQLPSGKWRVKVPVGKTAKGATRYRSKDCATKTEARLWQQQLITLRQQQQLLPGPKTTFKSFATELFLTPSDQVRARTNDGYFRNLSLHVFPVLGGAGTPLSEPLPIGVVVGVGDSMPR